MKPTNNKNATSPYEYQTLYPVIMAVPESVKALTPKKRVQFLSQQARRALQISAERSRVPIGKLAQDERSAPLPFDGTYWSISHKSEYVAGVVAPSPVGIDIEKICPRTKSLFAKIASEAEWALADTSFKTFFRYWTAKEAVLKAAGIGLKALAKCRVIRVVDAQQIDMAYEGNTYRVQHYFFDDHIAAVVKNDFEIDWTVVPA